MANSVCQNCGSRHFRADRSMAGRLICQGCGLAVGSRVRQTSLRQSKQPGSRSWKWILGLMVLVIILVIITG
ncbi:transcriptional regulator [Synechococcus sp. M16CYN]|uniref:transcriptional regulator n=1 Tax=Synechococcus sp. M16CYN TaxID=3103139 RepID=UPI0033427324